MFSQAFLAEGSRRVMLATISFTPASPKKGLGIGKTYPTDRPTIGFAAAIEIPAAANAPVMSPLPLIFARFSRTLHLIPIPGSRRVARICTTG
jgi:hypothetical protein